MRVTLDVAGQIRTLLIGTSVLLNCYGGWEGFAEIVYTLTLTFALALNG